MHWYLRIAWKFGAIFFLLNPMYVLGGGFDVKTLEGLGYSADIASFFDKSRFLPGIYPVTLTVNAAQQYREDVRFGSDGTMCVDENLANALSLKINKPLVGCVGITQLWGEAQEVLSPGMFRVEMTLPERAFDAEKRRGNAYEGYAAFLNYDIYRNQIRGSYGQRNTLQAMIEPGINVTNWVIRNRSFYSRDEIGGKLDVQETSALREVSMLGSLLQAGEFGAGGTLNAGTPLTGVQLFSDSGQQDTARLTVPVQGGVNSQATIEVRQRGNMVYRTLVPPGPFILTSLGQAVGGVEAEVLIIESDGHQQRFLVTPAIGGSRETVTTYQAGIGRYRPYVRDNTAPVPILLLGEVAFSPGARHRITTGGILSEHYRNMGGRTEVSDEAGRWISSGVTYSQGRRRGILADVQGQIPLAKALFLSLSARYRSRGHQTVDEAFIPSSPTEDDGLLRQSESISLTWSTMLLGTFSYSLSANRSYGRSGNDKAQTLTFGRRFGSATVSLNVQSAGNSSKIVYASISLPLFGGNASSRLQRQRNSSFLGSRWQGDVGTELYGNLDIAGNGDDRHDFSGSVSGETAYSRLGIGTSHSDSGSQSLTLSSSGAVGVANGIWITTPDRVGDTFAVVSIPGQPGLRVSGGAGGGITDFAGDVLLGSLQPNQVQEVAIDMQRLPLNLRLNSTSTEFRLARGSVGVRRFQATQVRQLLLTVRDSKGITLPVGASVHDVTGALLGTLMGDGNVILVNDDIGKQLFIRRVNMPVCRVTYRTPEVFAPEVIYEERDALCTEESASAPEQSNIAEKVVR